MKTTHPGAIGANAISASNFPHLSYSRALALWFFLPCGTIYQVRSSDVAAFKTFIILCTSAWLPEKRVALLADLAIDEELGKWHILNELSAGKAKVHVPLFATPEEALTAYRLMKWLGELSTLFAQNVDNLHSCVDMLS